MRRLYDISNILSALRVISKTQLPASKKPAFQWLGLETNLMAAEIAAQQPDAELPGHALTCWPDLTNKKCA